MVSKKSVCGYRSETGADPGLPDSLSTVLYMNLSPGSCADTACHQVYKRHVL